ncbi:MAG: AMP-binding protein [Actinobacteria bacterium]|nr:AMP-binding protein [Actinomycetota bacterium]
MDRRKRGTRHRQIEFAARRTGPLYEYDPAPFRRVFERDLGYLAGVARNASRFAGELALAEAEGERSWTYAELWRDACRLAGALAARGVRPGQAVVFQLFNGPEFALTWLAALRLGAIATPINFRLSAGETAHVLDDSRPAAFIFDAELGPAAREALALASHSPYWTAVVGEDFEALLLADATPPPLPDRDVYGETTRLYTSGTTGLPKGVSLNDLVEVMSAHDVIMHFPLAPDDRTLNMTPWFHRGGLYSGGPNPVFYVGAAAVSLRAFDPAAVLDLVAARGLTFLVGAPTNLAMLAEEQRRSPRDLASLRGIVTMGAPLEREACLLYQEVLTPRIFNGYGTTESFWNTFLRPADLPAHAGSAGRACTDDDVVVARSAGDGADPADPVARDGEEVGEVVVRTPKAGYAYVNQPEEQAARFRDGWFHTGDLATWDGEGFVTIVGRGDDMLISGGENVHPVQVEEVLNEHPDVADSCVVGLPDERWGELIVAYVVPAGGGGAASGDGAAGGDAGAGDPDGDGPGFTVAALDAHCREHPMLADYKRPRAYRLVESLPMTATGKKMHFRLRETAIADYDAGLLERP